MQAKQPKPKSQKYVSRGGDKLESVAGRLNLDFNGKVVLDVGSSTGGFTDYALRHGAAKVYAVDSGTDQLDPKLRPDPRVVVMERTDIRHIRLAESGELEAKGRELPEVPGMVLIDVSFISLKEILPAVKKLSAAKTQIVAMAKPHFEAASHPEFKNRGVIKNDTMRRQILKGVELYLKRDFNVIGKADSKVLGRKGNQERFYLLKLGS